MNDFQPLYVKKGRRYQLWGNEQFFADVMPAGTYRFVYCPKDGERRYTHAVSPDAVSFLAATEVARYAMEQALLEKAKAHPHPTIEAYSPEQQAIITRFREDMVAAGALLPVYWTNSTAMEIAQAGIDAVNEMRTRAPGAVVPTPAEQRNPTPEDCNEKGECWWYDNHGMWCLDLWQGNYSHWLPYQALPEIANEQS